MTNKQKNAINDICKRFGVPFNTNHWHQAGMLDGLPVGYVCGWVGDKIYVGVSPDGRISS